MVGRSMKTYSLHLQDINFLIALVSMEFVSLLKQIDSMLPQNVEHLRFVEALA